MTGDWLYNIGEIAIGIAFAAVQIVFAEIGYRFGRRHAQTTPEGAQNHVSTVEGSALGLLALLLGFAFAMSVQRYDLRKQAVLAEVNDLSTTFLRANLLPEPHASRSLDLLKEYVDVRSESSIAAYDLVRINDSEQRIVNLQIKLWSEAVAASNLKPEARAINQYIDSLNALIDDDTKRQTAMDNHVPETILWLLIAVAAASLCISGYSCGLKSRRFLGMRLVLILLTTATLLVIIDLDRPRRGLIQVSETGMESLKKELPQFRIRAEAQRN